MVAHSTRSVRDYDIAENSIQINHSECVERSQASFYSWLTSSPHTLISQEPRIGQMVRLFSNISNHVKSATTTSSNVRDA
jgi:hypothetical protein